jgi:hypothetical protein
MFSPQIVDSDAFLDMSPSAQNLYFHLGMRADDDGFVGNPKKVLRMIGGNDDDLKLLLAKRFILTFESGVIVIKHWRINNLVRKDWYRPTQYLEEKSQLLLKENGSYTDNPDNGIYLGNETAPKLAQVRSRRLGKDRIGKEENTSRSAAGKSPKYNPLGIPILDAFKEVDSRNGTYYGNTTQRKACDFLLKEYGMDKTLAAIKLLPRINEQKLYIQQITTPYELMNNWVKLGNAVRKSAKSKSENIMW